MRLITKISSIVLLMPMIATGSPMNTQIDEGWVRNKPSFLGDVVDRIVYGEQVDSTKTQGSWLLVTTKRKSGWIHQSALSTSKINLVPGGEISTGASGKEIALTGKGFSADIENSYKAKHKKISFAWVDNMEKFTIKNSEIESFIKQGELNEGAL